MLNHPSETELVNGLRLPLIIQVGRGSRQRYHKVPERNYKTQSELNDFWERAMAKKRVYNVYSEFPYVNSQVGFIAISEKNGFL